MTNANKVRLYKPISCCNVLYKLITKVLTNKLKGLMLTIVSQDQAGFIPNWLLRDIVLLANELIKGHGRKYMTPSCMIKIYIRKA